MRTWWTIAFVVAATAAIVGCKKEASETPPAGEHAAGEAAGHEDHDHDHGAGPHGGTIIEWGGGAYHLELVVDHDAKSATAYVLGGDAKTPAPIKADKLVLALAEPEAQIDLAAQPLDGEAGGMASRFVGTHDSLGDERELAGSITAEVEGTPYSGDFAEEAGDHDHAH